jgi:hypothetical protein
MSTGKNNLMSPRIVKKNAQSTHVYDTEEWIGVDHYTNNKLDEIDRLEHI